MTDEEALFIVKAVAEIAVHHPIWKQDYVYNQQTNEFTHTADGQNIDETITSWFKQQNT